MKGSACNDCGMLVREPHDEKCRHNHQRQRTGAKASSGLTPPKRGRAPNPRH